MSKLTSLNLHSLFTRLAATPWLAEALALCGGILYTVMLFTYAHTRESVLDEGAYLYKGYLFASGEYAPYQPYGPWTNHTPLAFMIPGFVQVIFGPGIRTGRYFAIGAALLMLVGLWILARRLGNRWWATGAIWVLAANPTLLKTYATAVSQGIIACMLVWMLVFVLGDKRPAWQILLGSILAGLMAMTRINMLPVVPLVLFYIFWQHGKKAGLAATAGAGATLIGIHALYWPNILQVWNRLPKSLTPFLNEWRLTNAKSSWQPANDFSNRVMSFFAAIRIQFTASLGLLGGVLFWPKKDRWKSQTDLHSAVFLVILFIALFVAHAWFALGKDYCVYCLPGYMAFFSETGLLVLILSFLVWRKRLPKWSQALIAILVVVLFAGIGFSAFENLGEPLYNIQLPRWLLGSTGDGSASLGAALINKFNLEARLLRRLLPTAFGIGFGLAILGVALAVRQISRRKTTGEYTHSEYSQGEYSHPLSAPSFGYWALTIALLAGTLLTPTAFMAGGPSTYDCTGDVIQSYETAGKALAAQLLPGARVYWAGGHSVVPLLYIPDIQIYPAQINGDYSFVLGGDVDKVLRLGKWNQEIAQRWASEADYILIQEHFYLGWLKVYVKSENFRELEPTPLTVACRTDSFIRVFQQIR